MPVIERVSYYVRSNGHRVSVLACLEPRGLDHAGVIESRPARAAFHGMRAIVVSELDRPLDHESANRSTGRGLRRSPWDHLPPILLIVTV